MLSDLLRRLRALFRRQTVEGELADELCFHLARQVEKYVQAGYPSVLISQRDRAATLHLPHPILTADESPWDREEHEGDRIPERLIKGILDHGNNVHHDRQRRQAQ